VQPANSAKSSFAEAAEDWSAFAYGTTNDPPSLRKLRRDKLDEPAFGRLRRDMPSHQQEHTGF